MNQKIQKSHLRQSLLNSALILGEYAPEKFQRICYDIRESLLSESQLNLAAALMWNRIKPYKPDYLVGEGYGSLILMTAIKFIAENENYKLKILAARSSRKDRHRCRLVEGPRPTNYQSAVFVDDIINSGDTYASTINALKEENIDLNILAICVLIDLWRFNGSRRLEIQGVKIERIFYRHDLGDTRIDPKNKPVLGPLVWRNLANNQHEDFLKSPPLIYENFVYYLNDRHEVYCHDLQSGEIIWNYKGPKPTWSKGTGCVPQVVNGILYVTSYDGSITAFRHDTGDIVWKKYLDLYLHGTPWIDLDRKQVYIATEGGIENRRGDIVCLDIDTAQTKWVFPTDHVVPCSPRLVDDQVICGSNDGNLYSLNADTGELLFKLPIGIVKGRVNQLDDTILACVENGKLFGISKTGEILWQRHCGIRSYHQFLPVNETCGLVYVGNSEGMMTAFDSRGNKKWMRHFRESLFWNITLKNNTIVAITSKQGHLYVVNAATGRKIKYQRLPDFRSYSPVDFNDEFIALHSLDNGLYLYRRNND